MRRLAAILALVLGLTLLAAPPASAAVAAHAENRASGSATAPNNLIGIEARLSEEAVRENAGLDYDIASDDAVAAKWTLGSGKSATKWANQMAKRGWSEKQIGEALSTKGIPARNAVNPGNQATRHVHPETGQSVVIDNKTNEIIHVGGKNFDYSDWDLLP